LGFLIALSQYNHLFAYQGYFSNALSGVDNLGIFLLKGLISDHGREHMAGDVPSRSGNGQYDKREKYKGCD
jgi:hypothetical protein